MIMDELFQRLEKRIKQLHSEHIALKHHNQQLAQKKSVLAHEKETLASKQQKAIAKIESLLTHLKTLEKNT